MKRARLRDRVFMITAAVTKWSGFRWPRPSHLLVALWMLMFLKAVEAISPLYINVTLNTCSTIAFLLLLIPTLFFPVGAEEARAECKLVWTLPLLAGSLVVGALGSLAHWFGRFGYRISLNDLFLVSALFSGLTVCGWVLAGQDGTARRKLLFLGFCWIAFSLAWTVPLRRFPLDGERSDMLPAVVSAVETWLSGQPPYQWHDVGVHRVPLTYLPLMWLSYTPAVMLKVDPRWLVLPAQLAFLLVLWVAFRPHTSKTWWVYVLWMALNPFLFIRHDIHVYLLWPFVAATLLCMLRRRWTLASVLWGLLLAFRKTLWIPFPFYLAFLLWNTGWRNALRCGLVTAAILLLVVGPFILDSPTPFNDGVIGYQRGVIQEMPSASWERVAAWTTGFSLVPMIHLGGGSSYLEAAQMVVVALMFIVTMLRRPDLAGTLQIMSITLLLFLLLNPLIEVYMYAPVLIFTAFTALARQHALSTAISSPESQQHSDVRPTGTKPLRLEVNVGAGR